MDHKTTLVRLMQTSGTVRLHDREVAITGPRDALENGLTYLTEDRKRDGLLLDKSIAHNVIFA